MYGGVWAQSRLWQEGDVCLCPALPRTAQAGRAAPDPPSLPPSSHPPAAMRLFTLLSALALLLLQCSLAAPAEPALAVPPGTCRPLSGAIEGCCCDAEAAEAANAESILPILDKLTKK